MTPRAPLPPGLLTAGVGAFCTHRFCGIVQTHFCSMQAAGPSHSSHRHFQEPPSHSPGSLKPWPCTQGTELL